MRENIFFQQHLFDLLSKTEVAALEKIKQHSVFLRALYLVILPWRHLSIAQADELVLQVNATQRGHFKVTVTTDQDPAGLLSCFLKFGITHVFASYCRPDDQTLFLDNGIDLLPFPLLPNEGSDAWGLQDLWANISSEMNHCNFGGFECFTLPGFSASLWQGWMSGNDVDSSKSQLRLLYGPDSLIYDITMLGIKYDSAGQSDLVFLLLLLERFKLEGLVDPILINLMNLTISRLKLLTPDVFDSVLSDNVSLNEFCKHNMPSVMS